RCRHAPPCHREPPPELSISAGTLSSSPELSLYLNRASASDFCLPPANLLSLGHSLTLTH
ncbi:hypothetical protein A2U01_0103945, partial [Trifolium medium]|nr:hypothetical protein [Trifolium medium]